MSTPRSVERTRLTADEFELVDQARHPALAALRDGEIARLIGLLRERRDRARDLANRQRRSVQGRQRDGVSTLEVKDLGNRRKAGILGEALARLSKERKRRRAASDPVASARKALKMKREAVAGAVAGRPDPGRRSGSGMAPNETRRADRIGSAMEAGRVSQSVRDAQAKRDAG